MSRYAQRFQALKDAGKKAFMPFTLLGWPNAETSLADIRTMIASGVSALELGFPFSDPVADGPVIQQAATEALDNGFTIAQGFDLLKQVRAMDAEIPIGLLVYYNLVLSQGVDGFFAQAAEAGVDGVLMADLPPEAAGEILSAAQSNGIDLIWIVSPLTTDARLDTIRPVAGGFLYVVSRLGITGVEERTDQDLSALLSRLNEKMTLPKLVGFGISSSTHAEVVLNAGADGVICGSRIIQILSQSPADSRQANLAEFLADMLSVCQSSPIPTGG